MIRGDIHRVQMSILRSLRRGEASRFSELMRPTDLTSDDFKFHLRRLIELGFVQKDSDGGYSLSPKGKEFANNLDEARRATQKQPKLSVMLVVPSPDETGRFLFQRRKRSPYFGLWGTLSGPVCWGNDVLDTARQELEKQAGLTAEFEVCGCLRVRDFVAESTDMLEDKLFLIVRAMNVRGQLANDWSGGESVWLGVDELRSKPRVLDSSFEAIRMVENAVFYGVSDIYHDLDEY